MSGPPLHEPAPFLAYLDNLKTSHSPLCLDNSLQDQEESLKSNLCQHFDYFLLFKGLCYTTL